MGKIPEFRSGKTDDSAGCSFGYRSAEWKLGERSVYCVVEDGKLYGLGSNDTGGSVVAMMAAFLQLAEKKQAYNLVCLESAEEENTGKNGIQRIVGNLGKIDLALIGEPTGMQAAIAEKGLMVSIVSRKENPDMRQEMKD